MKLLNYYDLQALVIEFQINDINNALIQQGKVNKKNYAGNEQLKNMFGIK